MNQRLTTSIAALALAVSGVAAAQEQATVLKRDGTRVSGRFEAWNRDTNTLFLRLSLADQRKIPVGEAAVFEVAGNAENLPANELEAARGSDHVLVLRNGEVLRGRLLNIEGGEGSGKEDEPRILSFKPNGAGEKRAPFSEVRRLYFGNFPSSLTASTSSTTAERAAEEALPPGAVRVAANAGWVNTGFTLTKNDRVQFTTTGQVQLSNDAEDKASSAGSLRGRYAANAPAPALLAGALIGRIGNGQPFAIGNQTAYLPMPGQGQLFLAVNDDPINDNQGAFVVTLRVTRGRR
ncbi:MAG: hypothetical protein KA371_05160 [Acidobacteria bacterium]|nr:hypothetical protein [Acidobacteriota bacterium]